MLFFTLKKKNTKRLSITNLQQINNSILSYYGCFIIGFIIGYILS